MIMASQANTFERKASVTAEKPKEVYAKSDSKQNDKVISTLTSRAILKVKEMKELKPGKENKKRKGEQGDREAKEIKLDVGRSEGASEGHSRAAGTKEGPSKAVNDAGMTVGSSRKVVKPVPKDLKPMSEASRSAEVRRLAAEAAISRSQLGKSLSKSAESSKQQTSSKSENGVQYEDKVKQQEMIGVLVKGYLKPFYAKAVIGKEAYKAILGKSVEKIYQRKSEKIVPEKVKRLVLAYVERYKR